MLKRINEVPLDLLQYLDRKQQVKKAASFEELAPFASYPVREVKMKILRNDTETFCPVVIPAVDVFTRGRDPVLRPGFLKRDSLAFFINGTKEAFPFGHVYRGSGSICLGSLFVPSAVPQYSPAMPLETLFLSNDRNLNHGCARLSIPEEKVREILNILSQAGVEPSAARFGLAPGRSLLKNDEIWNLSADVAEQKPLPDALSIMASVYRIVFAPKSAES